MKKVLKRMMAAAVAMVMFFTLLPQLKIAKAAEAPWTDLTEAQVYNMLLGDGTADNPFEIRAPYDFYLINYVEYYNTIDDAPVYYKQTQDIDLTSINAGSPSNAYVTTDFNGVYDGNGFKITGAVKPLFNTITGNPLYSTTLEDVAALSSNYNGNWQDIYSAQILNITLDSPIIGEDYTVEGGGFLSKYIIESAIYNCHIINGISVNKATTSQGGFCFVFQSSVFDSCSVENVTMSTYAIGTGGSGGISETSTTTVDAPFAIIYNCSVSGTISEANSYAGGILNTVGSLGTSIPIRIVNCHSSADIIMTGNTVTNVGGIISGHSAKLVSIENCVFDGSITMPNKTTGTAYIGGITGGISVDSVSGASTPIIINCSADNATLPDFTSYTDPNNIISGKLAGRVSTVAANLTGNITTSTADTLGDYGCIMQATLTDATVDNLSGPITALNLMGNTTINSITSTSALTINNFSANASIGSINSTGAVTIPTNMGNIGGIMSGGLVTIGVASMSADGLQPDGVTPLVYGNNGTIGNITSVGGHIYRNTGTISDVDCGAASFDVGQTNNYQINSGTIGNITTSSTIGIYSVVAGQVGELSAGGLVNIGYPTLLNAQNVPSITAGTINVYNGTGNIGDINVTSGTVISNAGNIGNVIATTGGITIGTASKAADDTIPYNNSGTIGNLTAATNVVINRNTGTIGDVTTGTTLVIGQNNATYSMYELNSGTIGSLNVGTTTSIFNNSGDIAYADGQSIFSGSSIAIGAAGPLYQNTGNIGPMTQNQATGTINIYSADGSLGDITQCPGTGVVNILATGGAVGNVMQNGTGLVTVGAAASLNKANIGNITALGAVTVYSDVAQIGAIKAAGNITIGAAATLNKADIGDITATGAANTITIYSDIADIGQVASNGTGLITIGATTPHSGAQIAGVNAPNAIVTGFSDTAPWPITASDNRMLFFGTDLNIAVTPISIELGTGADADKTFVYDSSNNVIGQWMNTDTKNITVASSCVISDIGAGVELNMIRSLGLLTITANNGTINTLKNNTSNITVTTNNGTINSFITGGVAAVSNNNGTIATLSGGTGANITTNNATGVINNIISNNGYVTLTGNNTGTINYVEANGTAASTIKTSTVIPQVVNNGTGVLTLNSGLTTSAVALFPSIKTRGSVTVTNAIAIGPNDPSQAINVQILDGVQDWYLQAPNGTGANNKQYIIVTGSISGILNLQTQTGGSNVNTIDVSGVTYGSLVNSVGSGTTVISNTPAENVNGDNISASSLISDTRQDVNANTAIEVDANGSINGTLYMNSTGPYTIYNYGHIENIVRPATTVLTIYNFAGATIGNVYSAGPVNIVTNYGEIDNVTAVGTITVGLTTLTGPTTGQVHYTATPTGDYDAGNNEGGTIGNLTSTTGAVTIWRNAGTIGDVSAAGAFQVGQNAAANASYEINSGTIGGVTTGGGVYIYNNSGNISMGGQSITTTTNITVGATTGFRNTGNIGDMNAGTTATIYADSGNIGNVSAAGNIVIGAVATLNGANIAGVNATGAANTIAIYSDSANIGPITGTSIGTVTIGATTTLNKANIASIDIVGGTLTIYSDTATIGSIKATGAIVIGSAAAPNKADIASIDGGSTVTLVSDTATVGAIKAIGNIAIGAATYVNKADIASITATGAANTIIIYSDAVDIGPINSTSTGAVTIGSATLANKADISSIDVGGAVTLVSDVANVGAINAAGNVAIGAATFLNQADIASITATGAANTIGLYNGNATVGDINGTRLVTIYCNDKQIGNVNAIAAGVTVGVTSKAADDTIVRYGNNGTIGNISANGAATIWRNVGTIGDVVATGTAGTITIGQNNTSYASYEINSGTIGNLTADLDANIYNNSGSVAYGGNIVAGRNINVGNTSWLCMNSGNLGNIDCRNGVLVLMCTDGEVGSVIANSISWLGNSNLIYNGALVTNDDSIVQNQAGGATIGDIHVTGGGSTIRTSKNLGDITIDGAGTLSFFPYGNNISQNITMGTGTATITNYYNYNIAPIVNLITSGSVISNLNTTAGGATFTIPVTQSALVNVVNNVPAGSTVTMTGPIESVNVAGDGTVNIASGSVASVPIVSGNGTIQYLPTYTTSATMPLTSTQGLWLEDQGAGNIRIHMATTSDATLPDSSGTLSATINGTPTEIPYTVGGAFAEPIGTMSLSGHSEDVINIAATDGSLSASTSVTLPDLIDNVKTIYIDSQATLDAVLAQYMLTPTDVPTDFPCVAVIPTLLSAYADSTVTVNGTAVDMTNDGIAFVPVTDPTEGTVVPIDVTAVYDGRITDDRSEDYTVSQVDAARSDNGGADYYFVQFRPNTLDGTVTYMAIPKSVADVTALPEPSPTRDRYVWAGWGTGDKLDPNEVRYFNPTDVTLTGDTIFEGRWDNAYYLSVACMNADTGSYTEGIGEIKDAVSGNIVEGSQIGVVAGDSVTLTGVNIGNMMFKDWTVDGDSDLNQVVIDGNSITFVMNSDIKITANFTNKPDPTAPTGLTANVGQTLADVTLPDGWTWDAPLDTVVGPEGINQFTASFAGDDNYSSMDNVSLDITVSKNVPSTPTDLTANVGQTLGDITLPAGWTWDDPLDTPVGLEGTNQFTASYAGDDTYAAQTGVSLDVVVSKSEVPMPTVDLSANVGQTLADVTLPDGWAWDEPLDTVVGPAGTNTFTASFAGDDTYNAKDNVSFDVVVSKNPVDTSLDLTGNVGQTLGDITLPAGWTWDEPLDTPVGPEGTNQFTASYAGDDTYAAQTGVTLDIIVSAAPTPAPTEVPTAAPTEAPTTAPTQAPTMVPTSEPTAAPTKEPTGAPQSTLEPTAVPTVASTPIPTAIHDWVPDAKIQATFETDDHISYINGYPDGTVCPDGNITRAEVATIFFRLLKDSNKNVTVQNNFPDIPNDIWYTQAVDYLTKIGILQGYDDGTFRPNQSITRAEFAAIASRFDDFVNGVNSPFSDVSDPNYWAYGSILSAYEKGWVTGYPDGTFKPTGNITRAEVVTIVNKILGRRLQAANVPAAYVNMYSDLSPTYWAFADIIEASVAHDYTRDANGYETWK